MSTTTTGCRRTALLGLTIAPLATTAVLAVAGPASAFVPDATKPQPAVLTSSAQRIPISAEVTGQITTSPDGRNIAFTATGDGTMRGYGHVRFTVTDGVVNPNRPCPTFTGTEAVQVTSSGDRLVGQVTGDGCPQQKNPAILQVQAYVAVSKGTGGFAGAGGGWQISGTLNDKTGSFQHQLSGLVLIPAS